MARIFFGLFLICCFFTTAAQVVDPGDAVDFYKTGEEALLAGKEEQAIRFFRKAVKAKPDFNAARRGLALCLELQRDYEGAAQEYKQILDRDSLFSRAMYFQAGEAFYKAGKPEEALGYFSQYEALQKWGVDTFSLNTERELEIEEEYLRRLPGNIRACEVSLDSIKFINITTVEPLGGQVNTKADDYFPFLTNDQKLLYFTRKTDKGDEDLYESEFTNGQWSRGRPVRDLNTSKDEGMSTFVRDGRVLFYTVCGREGVLGGCDIWQVEMDQNREVTGMAPLDGFANSGGWESQAAISCDGQTLYFASNRPGGVGGTDLYVCERQPDGSWGEAVNLGAGINSKLDEEAPFITNDGQTLYFSSNGHPGMGDQDIFMSWKDNDGEWSVPINLGPPVNSAFRELGFFLTADGQTGYFASDRPEESAGGLDIFRFRLDTQLYSRPITFVEGLVIDSSLEMTVSATVSIEGRQDIQVGRDGRFFLCVPAGDTLFAKVSKKFFHPYENAFIIPRWNNRQFYTIELLLHSTFDMPDAAPAIEQDTLPAIAEPLPRKKFVEYTHTVFFPFDEDKMEIEEREKLLAFLKPLQKKDAQDIRIVGFSDDIGTDDYNLRLSEERAKQIALVIMDNGLEVDHIYMEGKGEVKDETTKALNRRVEVKIRVLE
ncbi:MAG: OmpA family protein [bacterium]|nr:OmpA family protein [bacterium]